MSKRRSDTRFPRPAESLDASSFRPIDLVRFDLATNSLDGDVSGLNDRRVWVEATARGRVVGRVEFEHGTGALTPNDLEALGSTFHDDGPALFETIPDDQLATVTVVISTICSIPAQLVRTVQSLLELDYPSFDVVIVDNRSGAPRDPLPAMPDDPRVRVTRESMPGISSGRNRGVAESTGEILAFTDDDALVDRMWLRAIGARFAADPSIDAIGGLVLPSELETEPQLWFEEYYGGFSKSFQPSVVNLATDDDDVLFPYAPRRFGAGCNMAFRRSTLEAMGGFDVALGVGTPAFGGEDLASFIELVTSGGTVAFEPAALVRHTHRRTERAFLRQVLRYGVGLTAMYTSLLAHDRRHALAILRKVPGGVRLLTRPRGERSMSVTPSYPRRALLYQVLGMGYGPIAYARSRWWARRAA
jgi:GT2 family glycosyltransferase